MTGNRYSPLSSGGRSWPDLELRMRYNEPVWESAPIAQQLARTLCARDADTGESCASYHGFWQYLRPLNLVTTPAHHTEFFRRALPRIEAGCDPPRVLVSGAADYAMLVQVLIAFQARDVAPCVSVVDRCATPLALNEWYAARVGMPITWRFRLLCG